MAHGERARRWGHVSREYWSRRLRGMWNWGRFGKALTHTKERAARRREEHAALDEARGPR